MLIELVSPTMCLACGTPCDGDLCPVCADDVHVLAQPLQHSGDVRVGSLVAFAEPARSLTLLVKRRGSVATARAIGGLLASLAEREGLGGDVVTSVPGQGSELIARAVAGCLGLPVRKLMRRAAGPRQSEVPLAARRDNVRGRFSAASVRGSVLLVDDVLTTGATVEACAAALQRAGASSVDVLTWARTLRRGPILSR